MRQKINIELRANDTFRIDGDDDLLLMGRFYSYKSHNFVSTVAKVKI